jgi:hypothetical protein
MKVKPYKIDTLSFSKKNGKNDHPSCGDLIVEIGRLFINKPYKAGTLESLGKEKLIVNSSAFDCITFVETVLALYRCAIAEIFSLNEFRKNLKSIRYRHGKINGYSSRLHYFTDWLPDNVKRGNLIDVSKNLGGKPQRKKINFMTARCEFYPAMKNEAQIAKMAVVEKNLSRNIFYVVEKDKANAQKANIKHGDIIAFTAKQEGLDVAHIGFAFWQEKSLRLRLLHASSKEGAVVISKKTLAAYLKSHKKFTGIIVARVS